MKNYYRKKDAWWVSPYNYYHEVIGEFSIPDKVSIHDATLRDGEQTPGVVFRPEDKISIAKKLSSVGVERIEAGMPAVSQDDYKSIQEITKLGLNSKIYSFARALNSDIDKAVECGVDGVVLEVPIGYPKLKYQFNWTWEDVFKKSADVINYAKSKNLEVVYFPYDTTRAREEDIDQLLYNIMKFSPPDSIGVVDTMGCALPQAIVYLVKKFKDMTNLPIEIHTHNDFGMAVATELMAVTAGAEVIHSCVNGLGERTGNAALEELMICLHILLGIKTNYKFDQLMELSDLVRRLSKTDYAKNKPVVGERNFTRESGIGIDLVINQPLAMFGTSPSFTGRKGDIVLGKKSGKLSVEYFLKKHGYENDIDDTIKNTILEEIKKLGIKKQGLLTDGEFDSIVKKILEK